MTIHQDRRMAQMCTFLAVPKKVGKCKLRGEAPERGIGVVRPEFAAMAPCVPSLPTGECDRCARHAPKTIYVRRLIRIDASILERTDGRCPMAA